MIFQPKKKNHKKILPKYFKYSTKIITILLTLTFELIISKTKSADKLHNF